MRDAWMNLDVKLVFALRSQTVFVHLLHFELVLHLPPLSTKPSETYLMVIALTIAPSGPF